MASSAISQRFHATHAGDHEGHCWRMIVEMHIARWEGDCRRATTTEQPAQGEDKHTAGQPTQGEDKPRPYYAYEAA